MNALIALKKEMNYYITDETTFDDILHYQKIIVALTETDRLMKEIDKIDI